MASPKTASTSTSANHAAKANNNKMPMQGMRQGRDCPEPAAKFEGKKMLWTDANDEALLLYGLERKIVESEYTAIAKSLKGNPSVEAVKERLVYLEEEQSALLKKLGVEGDDEVGNIEN